jgi:DNA polymerase III subunit gamma/tau
MAYQVLARKYRPQRFSDVIGQEHVTQTLLNALVQDRIAHGYIFSGHRGIGKTTIARVLAMALECRTPQGTPERPSPEPCGVCDPCREIRAGNAMDVIEIDAATNRGIDEIRELREGARYSPARDRYKIYILDEAHQITDAAFNALLKTLEEPPAHVIFMMATTQPEDIPQTIRSRCQHFSFHAVRFEQIVGQLRAIAQKESIEIDEAALSLLAEAGDGSMRDALSIMDQAIASVPMHDGKQVLDAQQIRALMGTVSNQAFEDMMAAVKAHDAGSMLEQAATLLDAGNAPQQIARQMVRFLRNCLMASVAGASSDLLQVSAEERERALRIAAQFSEQDLTRFLNSMLRTFDDVGFRQEQRFHLELGLVKLVHMQRLLPFEELFRQLSGGPSNSGTRGTETTPAQPAIAAGATPVKAPMPGASHALEGVFAPAAKVESGPSRAPNASIVAPAATATPSQHREIPPGPDMPLQALADNFPSSSAMASEGSSASASSESAPPAEVAERFDSDRLRAAICEAMLRGGHETAGSLFEAGAWNWDGSELQIRVDASQTLLELVFTADAQRIVRGKFQQLTGSNRAVLVEPGEQSPAQNGKSRSDPSFANPPDARSGEAERPQDHPLIRHAQQLFHAEVRSVVSLRESR